MVPGLDPKGTDSEAVLELSQTLGHMTTKLQHHFYRHVYTENKHFKEKINTQTSRFALKQTVTHIFHHHQCKCFV